MDIKVIIGIIAGIVVLAGCVVWFIKLPNDKKIKSLKEWLKWAVVEAEKALGSGTGQLKLRMVYDLATKQFPWVSTLISFETFSAWVDEALDWMRDQLDKNEKIDNYIKE